MKANDWKAKLSILSCMDKEGLEGLTYAIYAKTLMLEYGMNAEDAVTLVDRMVNVPDGMPLSEDEKFLALQTDIDTYGVAAIMALTPRELRWFLKHTGWAQVDTITKCFDSDSEHFIPFGSTDPDHPTLIVKQKCEACGKTFLVRYKARRSGTGFISDGYDYLGEPCACESSFCPDNLDEPSISEWVGALNDHAQKQL